MPGKFKWVWILPLAAVVAVGTYFVPPVHTRAARRIEDIQASIKYFLHPPDQAVFLPTQQAEIDSIVNATMQAHATEEAPSATPTATAPTLAPTSSPTQTPTPLPPAVNLPGVVYVDQSGGWNLCAPANLTMALKFWGWKGTRDEVISVVKPGENDPSQSAVDRGFTDKNVMPYELVDFVNEHTDYRALYRYGGDIQMIKSLLAAGFPLVAEKGYYEADYKGKVGWLGHYQFVTGYDDATQELIVQDTYHDGPNFHISYDQFTEGWRSFDFVFYIVYPLDRQEQVTNLLGPYADADAAARKALDRATTDTGDLQGIDLFFAWFAKGTSHVALREYIDAAAAYDKAFDIYASLQDNDSERPYRIMWYETGPYWAYYYSGRYQDVINLANTTFQTIGQPTLEESLYWRGMAEYAMGNTQAAIADVQKSVYYNKNFKAGVAKLQEWGVGQ
jgi:tetratricopeptide (TPR) repeat protein